MPVISLQVGPYRGAVVSGSGVVPAWAESLGGVAEWVAAGAGADSFRHRLVRLDLDLGGGAVPVAVKAFARAKSRWRDADFRRRGSKAERSFRAAVRLAEHGVGTPAPLAFLDRWEGGRLVESYYLCGWEDGATNFRDELNRLYAEDPLCRRIMGLMETVALAVADLHDAGVCHRDLGNQNIMLRRFDDDTWGDVRFIDLNRAALRDALTVDERARDLSRIDLPSDFFRVFLCMYGRHQHPSAELVEREARYRRRFARHTKTRAWRHPIREARQRALDAERPFVPRGRELWVWDDRSVQAVSTLLSRDRHGLYPAGHSLRVGAAVARRLPAAWRQYRALLPEAFTREVDLRGRIGVAVGTTPASGAEERRRLDGIGRVPVLLRLYHHEGIAAARATLETGRRLRADGHAVMAALVQDRAAVRDPARWAGFVGEVMPGLAGVADWIEVGHAVNRVKWGIWDVREYRRLLDPVLDHARGAGAAVRLTGPAVIDFEYHQVLGFLDRCPDGAFAALSHHLYVDRRGAPENRQGWFGTVEKCALAKALAMAHPAVTGDRLIVSEVNWPILGTDAWSPVNSPYIIPGSHTNDPSVDEETYASYLVRFYLLALCSGFVDAVYWWRLVARGFGLVDDGVTPWRARPGYAALQQLVRRLGEATFERRLAAPEGVWLLRFRSPSGPLVVGWSHPVPVTLPAPFRRAAVEGRGGEAVADAANASLTLDGSPRYWLGVEE